MWVQRVSIVGKLYSKHSCSSPVVREDYFRKKTLRLHSPAELSLAGRKEGRKSAKSEARLLAVCEHPVAESDAENF